VSEPSAQLTHRGESFEMREGERLYEGECTWSWENAPDGGLRPTYPLTLSALSIRCSAGGRRVALDWAEQLAAAREVKRLLELREGPDRVLVAP
jgi:hypothetical protein